MATALTTIDPAGDETIAAGVAGKVIRLRRIIASSSAQIVPKSNETEILPLLKSGTVGNVDLNLGDRPVPAARGEPLVISNIGPSTVTVYVEYDIVD